MLFSYFFFFVRFSASDGSYRYNDSLTFVYQNSSIYEIPSAIISDLFGEYFPYDKILRDFRDSRKVTTNYPKIIIDYVYYFGNLQNGTWGYPEIDNTPKTFESDPRTIFHELLDFQSLLDKRISSDTSNEIGDYFLAIIANQYHLWILFALIITFYIFRLCCCTCCCYPYLLTGPETVCPKCATTCLFVWTIIPTLLAILLLSLSTTSLDKFVNTYSDLSEQSTYFDQQISSKAKEAIDYFISSLNQVTATKDNFKLDTQLDPLFSSNRITNDYNTYTKDLQQRIQTAREDYDKLCDDLYSFDNKIMLSHFIMTDIELQNFEQHVGTNAFDLYSRVMGGWALDKSIFSEENNFGHYIELLEQIQADLPSKLSSFTKTGAADFETMFDLSSLVKIANILHIIKIVIIVFTALFGVYFVLNFFTFFSDMSVKIWPTYRECDCLFPFILMLFFLIFGLFSAVISASQESFKECFDIEFHSSIVQGLQFIGIYDMQIPKIDFKNITGGLINYKSPEIKLPKSFKYFDYTKFFNISIEDTTPYIVATSLCDAFSNIATSCLNELTESSLPPSVREHQETADDFSYAVDVADTPQLIRDAYGTQGLEDQQQRIDEIIALAEKWSNEMQKLVPSSAFPSLKEANDLIFNTYQETFLYLQALFSTTKRHIQDIATNEGNLALSLTYTTLRNNIQGPIFDASIALHLGCFFAMWSILMYSWLSLRARLEWGRGLTRGELPGYIAQKEKREAINYLYNNGEDSVEWIDFDPNSDNVRNKDNKVKYLKKTKDSLINTFGRFTKIDRAEQFLII